jgi:cysteinyl-tRNA synthetase
MQIRGSGPWRMVPRPAAFLRGEGPTRRQGRLARTCVVLALLTGLALACDLATLGPTPESPSSIVPVQTMTPQAPHAECTPARVRLAEVSRWLYLIGADLEAETVQRIVASQYDMVVLDFLPSEENNTDYPMADVVTRLHDAQHPKLVIAYVDVGQAENYRRYWQEAWEIGDPEWIVGEDPDGWEGNYPVAFWYDEWQEIWLGADGILQQILDDGFDGLYLDWIEAYADENVIAMAEQDGVDPVEEMIWWVRSVSDFVKSRCDDCVIIAQNAAELAEYDDYVEAIDAIAQEQVWFDGGADNDPPGDCPLPRSDAEVDTEAYRDSLSEPCRRYFDSDPDSPLHVSSEEYLYYLTLAQRKGILIFTVDYALDPENVSWVYETSRALGFVPFLSTRALDRYIEPVP